MNLQVKALVLISLTSLACNDAEFGGRSSGKNSTKKTTEDGSTPKDLGESDSGSANSEKSSESSDGDQSDAILQDGESEGSEVVETPAVVLPFPIDKVFHLVLTMEEGKNSSSGAWQTHLTVEKVAADGSLTGFTRVNFASEKYPVTGKVWTEGDSVVIRVTRPVGGSIENCCLLNVKGEAFGACLANVGKTTYTFLARITKLPDVLNLQINGYWDTGFDSSYKCVMNTPCEKIGPATTLDAPAALLKLTGQQVI